MPDTFKCPECGSTDCWFDRTIEKCSACDEPNMHDRCSGCGKTFHELFNQKQGKKNDAEKIRMDLLPMDALLEIGRVMTFGMKKYGERNWEKGIDIQRFRGAILRHDAAHEMGEELDPESGLPHKVHKACSALMELALYLRGQK